MQNKIWNPLLYLLVNYVSGRSATQILSLKNDYLLHFSNFLIIGLRNSSANCWFGIILPLIADSYRVG